MSTCPLKDTHLAQIGVVVRDLEETKTEMARFLGVEVPPTKYSGDYEVVHTEYKGEPAQNTFCYMAFFYLGDLQIEFIQPSDGPSVWQDFLEARGEGIHHLSFSVNGMTKYIESCEKWGMKMEQRGEYRLNNGRYAYLNAVDTLKMYIELLESDEVKETNQ